MSHSNHPIVKIVCGWRTLDSDAWALIRHSIAKGETIGVWNGYWRDRPEKVVEGKCSLKVKVGKRWKLVRGVITLDSHGHDGDGQDYCRLLFHPNKPRILSRKLHPAVYQYITD